MHCALCNIKIRNDDEDGMFICNKYCEFFIHKSCAEAPRYIHNSLHPMHPLELLLHGKYPGKNNVFPACRLCEHPIYEFGYKCSSSSTTTVCDFSLHFKCATESIFDPKDHQHSFRNLKPTLFTCDVCGIHEDTKCVSCMCSTCQLQVHERCRQKFPLSSNVRQRMHAHELKLCFSFQIGFDFSNKFCKICSNKMNNVLCLYQCNNKVCASYIAHVTCAISTDHLMENIDHEEEVELEEIDTEPKEVITHFSHPHSLILSNIELTYEAGCVCYGCVRPIISAPFYTCEKCNFFLHKQCSQLPTTIQSPVHQHPLVLKDYLDFTARDVFFHGFTCQACQVQCNGFAYMCKEDCRKFFDVGCTLFGDTLNHASHKCTLTMVSTIPNEEKRCIACDSTFSIAFWCEECNFFIDLKCASMPKTIGHNCPTGTVWTVKPLKLTYDCIEHVGDQYYCDLCEESRGKHLWFYYCEDCRESIHPQCLLVDGRFMYGKSYNINGHCHTVCVAKKPKTDPLCDTCGNPCQHSPLVFCPTCKVYFHDNFNCCGMSSSSEYKPIRNYCCGVCVSTSPNENENEDEDEDEEIRSEIEVNHFSHPHSLVIGQYDPKRSHGEVCDGCGMQISDPFYRCGDKKGKCNFFLHGKCFELPKQIQHRLHPDHPLVLNSFLDLPCNGEVGFICYGCDACSNGFFYTCLACKFFLDVRCSLLSDTLVHKSHQCPFTLRCATIDDQDGSGKYFKCYWCWGRIPSRKKEYYHYCEDCDRSAHHRCTSTARWGFIKSGIEYQAYNHFHNLFTVQDSYFKDCVVCKEQMKRFPAVYCKKCRDYFHVKCCRWLRRV